MWRTLMVALSTNGAPSKPLLRKALQLAQRFDASLHLVHVVSRRRMDSYLMSYICVPSSCRRSSGKCNAVPTWRSRRL